MSCEWEIETYGCTVFCMTCEYLQNGVDKSKIVGQKINNAKMVGDKTNMMIQ